ncbi:MAG: type IV pilus modification protein PilV [Alcanivoracaceae bacterium]|nr:type IV pilus modification protein PilV [Alcanivoracaceae bacterium]|tara:strand:+ start:2941 stop:3465 length:525 start_codon:yes stop_codon:yes gene_type:complete
MNKLMRGRRATAQKGIGLVEILVALLILAIGVLGYAGLQLAALKGAEEANNRSQATLIGQDALERIESNRAEVATYLDPDSWPDAAVDPGGDPETGCQASDCTSEQMATLDIDQLSWLAGNQLPNGRVRVSECNGNSMSCMVVSWGKMAPADCLTADGINVDESATCVVLEVSR